MIAIGSLTARLFSTPRQVGVRFNQWAGTIDNELCNQQALCKETTNALAPARRTPAAVGNRGARSVSYRGVRPSHFTRTIKKNLSIV